MPGGSPPFSGIGVALLTCFDEHGDLDAGATAALAVRLCDEGVTGVVVAGTTGEAATLEADERRRLVREVRRAVPPTVPVVAGTGGPSTRQAVRLTAEAIDAGADAVMALSPPRAVDMRPYYAAVAETAGPVPVLAYHFPAVSPPGIPVACLAELPVTGCKDSGGDADRLLEEVASFPGALYVGATSLVALAGLVGAAGAILALANLDPRACGRAFAGDPEATRSLAAEQRALRAGGLGELKRRVAARFGIPTTVRVP